MKRTIAIMLSLLALTLALTGCGGRNSGNVSESTNGNVTTDSGSTTKPSSSTQKRNENPEAKSQNDGIFDSSITNEMENAAENVGDAIGDAGKAVGDAVTGQNSTTGAGMTGGR